MLDKISKELKDKANPEDALFLQRFFKTGAGEYGEGDKLLGIRVPEIRKICKKYFRDISFADNLKLLKNPYHEFRLTALILLVYKYEKAEQEEKDKIFQLYNKNHKYINNWDLVDCSAHKIVGDYLLNKDRKLLYTFSQSGFLWSERISVISTFAFIRQNDFKDILKLSRYFLKHEHDLMHKACGWMLREMGKREIAPLIEFLEKHVHKMPRTMLRYAIEKLPEKQRKFYLSL